MKRYGVSIRVDINEKGIGRSMIAGGALEIKAAIMAIIGEIAQREEMTTQELLQEFMIMEEQARKYTSKYMVTAKGPKGEIEIVETDDLATATEAVESMAQAGFTDIEMHKLN